MKILIGERQEGKTTRLIQMSAAGEGRIVTATHKQTDYVKHEAKAMNLDIPDPICWDTLIHSRGRTGGPYLVDELGMIFACFGIRAATIDSAECAIENLSQKAMHYGDELAAKIRKNAKGFNKLSDFDKFVLDNGYRYETREELQTGYERHWKATHDILVTADEFLAEADKKPSDPAADTYKALVKLVEEKKLRPGEVFGYAHYHWCLNKPEAIVDYQTGRDEWSVNNCDSEITEETARIKVCEEWGFETGRVRIIGTPYYDATDYQFIRFNCAHMTWLWQNGSLHQVYC